MRDSGLDKRVRAINITGVFSSIDHDAVNQIRLKEILDILPDDESFIYLEHSPKLKMLLPRSKGKEIIIDNDRVRVTDRSPDTTLGMGIIDIFIKLAESDLVNIDSLKAYGFNYDVQANIEDRSDPEKLISGNMRTAIPQEGKIKQAGTKITYRLGKVLHLLEVRADINTKWLDAHFNVHKDILLVDKVELHKEELVEELREGFKTLESILDNLITRLR